MDYSFVKLLIQWLNFLKLYDNSYSTLLNLLISPVVILTFEFLGITGKELSLDIVQYCFAI